MSQDLSKYFNGAAAKTLAAVDCLGHGSNQHEVTGTSELLNLLGDVPRRFERGGNDERFDAIYVHIDSDDNVTSLDGKLSWYDSREKQLHRSPEWRLYYQENEVTLRMRPGDSLFILILPNRAVGFVTCSRDSSYGGILESVFSIQGHVDGQLSLVPVQPGFHPPADFLTFQVLDALGVEPDLPDMFNPDEVVARFRGKFPSTSVFSELARSTLPDINPKDDPDATLLAWIDREELLFRALERKGVGTRLQQGFLDANGAPDVEAFLKYSLSVQNRRKSRAGYALMNHFSKILQAFGIPFTPEATTEKKGAADFLFPSEVAYADPMFPNSGLRMVAAKTSCKDRWRQVLAEADRISRKHLLTLQPKISPGQTSEMQQLGIALTIPAAIHAGYSDAQRSGILTVAQLLEELGAL